MENENTLDLTKKGVGFTLEDLEDFGTPEAIGIPPVPVTPSDPVTTTTEPVVEPVKKLTSLDELETETNLDPVQTTAEQDLTLGAIKAVIKKKMEKYSMSVEGVDVEALNEEELADFNDMVDEAILEEKWNSVKSVNKNVDKLLTFLENKGNPEDLVTLFKKQQQLEKLDISTEKGQIDLLRTYYSEVLKLDDKKITDRIERLSASNLLEAEATDVEESYNNYIDGQQDAIIEAQQVKARSLERQMQQRKELFNQHLDKLELPKDLKQKYETTAFGTGKIKGSNEEIKILDYQILKLQSNPETFIKLVQFLSDPTEYDNMIKQGKENGKVVEGMKKGFSIPKRVESTDINTGQPAKTNFKKINLTFN